MKWRLNVLCFVTVLVGTVVATPLSALAATAGGFNLTASPLPVSLSTTPGQTISTPIRVENTGSAAVRIDVSLMKFSAFGDSGQPRIETPSPNDAYIKWVSFSQTSFIAQPNVFNTVTMTIKVPKTAAFGYYYAVVFNQDASSDPKLASNQNAVNGAIASLVLLNVNAPGEKKQLSAKSFTVSKKVYEYLPATFTVTVHNDGNIHVVPSGNVFITKNQKDDIAAIDLNAAQGNVLPGSNRQFSVQWDDGFPHYETKRVNGQIVSDKNGKPEQRLVWDFSKLGHLRLGHYYAQLDLVYNNGTQDVPVEGEVSFWVIPWRLLLGAFVLALLLLLGLFVPIRAAVRRTRGLKKRSA